MHVMRRSQHLILQAALWVLLLAAVVPTLSRLIAAADPVRAVMLAEICSVRSNAGQSDAGIAGDAAGGVHCADCLSPVLPADPVTPDRSADFDRPAARLMPVAATLPRPAPEPAWPQSPPRAPPAC